MCIDPDSRVRQIFIMSFFLKVCDQVLTDQVQGIISHLISNFIDSAASFNLTATGIMKQLNGDLRALILVSSTRSELLNQNLLQALRTLKTRVGIVLATVNSKDDNIQTVNAEESPIKNSNESHENTNSSTENTSNKKRRLSEEPSTSTVVKNVTKPKDEKTKWKESLMMFTSTLNLLISMGENALKNDDEKTEKPNDVESENPTSDDKKDEEVHEFDKEPKEK